MTDTTENRDSVMRTKLARLERQRGGFPVLSSEKREDYEELLISLLQVHGPLHPVAERLIKYLADFEWEIDRYQRHKTFLLERRFHARLAYQAYREKSAQENHAGLAKTLASHQAMPFTLPEEALDSIIAEVDAMLQRPAQEIDHARALEVGIVYFQHLDRLLTAAMSRRKAILADIKRYDYWFDPWCEPPLAPSALDEEAEESESWPRCTQPTMPLGGKRK